MATPGIPTITEVVHARSERLINGTEIQVAYENLAVAASQNIPYLAPVALDEDGGVIRAVAGTPAIGVAMFPIVTDADDALTLSVLRAGVLNPDALAWDASYATAADRVAAFRGAPAPTNIIVKTAI